MVFVYFMYVNIVKLGGDVWLKVWWDDYLKYLMLKIVMFVFIGVGVDDGLVLFEFVFVRDVCVVGMMVEVYLYVGCEYNGIVNVLFVDLILFVKCVLVGEMICLVCLFVV